MTSPRPEPRISLRPVEPGDVPTLYAFDSDPACYTMAGTKPRSREEFDSIWEGIFKNARVVPRVVLFDGQIVGCINCFQRDDRDCVGYLIARPWWGRGFATQALRLFLGEFPRRPLFASAITSNAASIRVLTRCGFRETHRHMGEETPRYVAAEVAEFVLE